MFQIKHTSLTMPACGSKKGHLRPKTARGARNANSAGLCRGEGRRTARRRVILARAQGLRAELNPPLIVECGWQIKSDRHQNQRRGVR